MSLIHWWPLNGNTKDYGINNVTMETISPSVVTNTSGKIGKCYYNNSNSTGGLLSTSTIHIGVVQSMFCWMKFTSLESSASLGGAMVGTHRYSTNTGMGITIRYLSSTTGRISVNTGTGSSRTYNTYYGNTTLNADTWYHVGFTYDGSTIRLYVNGTLDGTASLSGMSVPDDYVFIGGWSLGGGAGNRALHGDYKLNGYINDVRIYDHALSQKEVKELSKGLVLHYTFEDEYAEVTTNIDPTRSNLKDNVAYPTGLGRSDANAVIEIVNFDGYKCYKLSINKDNISSWYGVYFNSNPVSQGASVGQTVTRSMMMYVPSGQTLPGHFTESIEGNSSNKKYHNYDYTKPNTWQKVWCTGTITDTNTNNYLHYMCAVSSGSVHLVCYMRDFQMEIKDHPTPFTDSSRTVGKVYDSSGLGNNGTPYGSTLQIVGDSRIGNKCAKFDNTANSAIVCGNGMFVKDELTVNWWGYMSSWSSYGRAISCTEGGGWNFEPNSSKMGFPVYLSGIGYKSAVSTTTLANLSSGWHMFTGTYDGYTVKIYIDGVLESSISSGASSKTAIGYPSNGLFIGAEAAGTATTPTSPYFNGNMADVKIYATALSQQDIISEYDRRISIDRNGNFYSDEFVEEDGANTSVDKAGVTNTNVIATTMTLDDGSIWIPICMHYVPDGLNTSRSNKYCYTSRNIWTTFGIINDAERPESGYYEFYVMQQTAVNGAFSWFRFKQNINPFSATWTDVNPSKVGTNVTRISASTTNNYAGMYWMNNSSAAMCFANSSNGNWYGCGIQAAYQGGIPGYNGQTVLGWQIVYMRVTKTCAKMFKNGLVIANNIIEN